MKKLLVLLAAVCAVSVLAESTVLKVIDFETSEGYHVGDLLNQNGWYSIYSGADRQMVVNDPENAPSGSNYATYNPENSNGPNSAVEFDISGSYVAGNKLLISWDQAGNANDNFYVKVHNLVDDNTKRFDVEIVEVIINKGGYAAITVTKSDKSSTTTKNVAVTEVTAFHHFTMLIDPATRCIKEFTLDDNVIDDLSDTYYKNEKDGKPRGGDLVDGVRIMNKGSFDNFKVEMVPEPAVFGLIALLGLFFARKQR